jgi:hypothetical protein
VLEIVIRHRAKSGVVVPDERVVDELRCLGRSAHRACGRAAASADAGEDFTRRDKGADFCARTPRRPIFISVPSVCAIAEVSEEEYVKGAAPVNNTSWIEPEVLTSRGEFSEA